MKITVKKQHGISQLFRKYLAIISQVFRNYLAITLQLVKGPDNYKC